MPLLSEYANYGEWETDATRWSMMLHIRPIRLGVDYFANNSKDRKASKIDVEAVGFLKHKAKSEIGVNGKAIIMGELYEPIGYDWMCQILGGIPRTVRGPIVRIAKQLGEMERVIIRESELWERNPKVLGIGLVRNEEALKHRVGF